MHSKLNFEHYYCFIYYDITTNNNNTRISKNTCKYSKKWNFSCICLINPIHDSKNSELQN